MRTPAYYRVRALVRLTVWTAFTIATLATAQAIIWLAWAGLGM